MKAKVVFPGDFYQLFEYDLMHQLAFRMHKQVVDANKFKLTDVAVRELQESAGTGHHGFIHEFGAIHMVVGFEVERHIEHNALPVMFPGFGHYLLLQGIGYAKAEYAKSFVAIGFGKNGDGVAAYFLVGVPFTTECMVHKYRIVFDARNATMRIFFVTLVERSQAFAGKIVAGTGDEVAGMYEALDLVDAVPGPAAQGFFLYRIGMCHFIILVSGGCLTGAQKKNKAAEEPPCWDAVYAMHVYFRFVSVLLFSSW